MPVASRSSPRTALAVLALVVSLGTAQAAEPASRHLAPGFTTRPADSTLLVVAPDMELFSISAGGVQEPRADWTAAAQAHFRRALADRRAQLGPRLVEYTETQLDDFAELAALHRAVAEAVSLHHARSGMRLPTKEGRLDWSLGDAVQDLQRRSGADYALFTWMRDSYASGERKAAMLGMALLGALMTGGEQVGYASLVDLRTGRIVWFNQLDRMWGDLREPAGANETVEALLRDFPGRQGTARPPDDARSAVSGTEVGR